MVDSGAYSAWKQPKHKRKPIDLDAYISFCIANQAYIDTIVNLDVIPGEDGRKPTFGEVEDSAKKGYSNLKKMEEHGLSPIPVFHQGEDMYWLERLLGEGYIRILVVAAIYCGIGTALIVSSWTYWKSEPVKSP